MKELIDRKLPDEELWRLWKKKLYSRDEHIATKALKMALHYRFGKPMTSVAGPEEHPPIKIDISAILQFLARLRNDFAAARKRDHRRFLTRRIRPPSDLVPSSLHSQ